MILLNFGWMVDLAMSIFEFLTKFLVFWHPWNPWVCIRSDLKPLFETDMIDSSYSAVTFGLDYVWFNSRVVSNQERYNGVRTVWQMNNHHKTLFQI